MNAKICSIAAVSAFGLGLIGSAGAQDAQTYEFRTPVKGLTAPAPVSCPPDGAPASGWVIPSITVSQSGIETWRAPAMPPMSGCEVWYVGVEDVSATARGDYLGIEHHPIAAGAAAFGASDITYLTGAAAYRPGDKFAISYYPYRPYHP